ncbi:MAG: hypothetical protein ACRC3Z_06530 [Phocaeicola sp.]
MSNQDNLNRTMLFQTTEIQINNDEIVIDISTKKARYWGIVSTTIIFVGVLLLSFLVGENYSHLLQSNSLGIIGILIGFFCFNRLLFFAQKQYKITIDKKYLIVYCDNFFLNKQQVYKIEDIQNWSVITNYRPRIWTHIRVFLTKNLRGSIAFNYANSKIPIRIGYGLTSKESQELLNCMREKGWISNFQTSDAALKYKKNEKMKYISFTIIGLYTMGMVSKLLLKDIYPQKAFLIYAGISIIFVLFCSVMVCITYRQKSNNN